jgi:hypothetical protein
MNYQGRPLPNFQGAVYRKTHSFAHGIHLFAGLQVFLAYDMAFIVQAMNSVSRFTFHCGLAIETFIKVNHLSWERFAMNQVE